METDFTDLVNAARLSLSEGRMRDATELFQRIVTLAPNQANNWYNLGFARRGARDFEGALDAYSRAIKLGLDSPEEAFVNRAVILKDDLERYVEAEGDFKKAVAISPDFVPAWVNLGLLYEVLGRRDEAIVAYRRAVQADKRATGAHARIAALEADPQKAIAILVNVLRSGRLNAGQAADIEFALANALDRGERYSEAFMVASRANARKAAMRSKMFTYDRNAYENLVDALIENFSSRPILPCGAGDKRHVFLCGMFRSGSTLAEQLLGRHPSVSTAGELEAIPVMVREQLQPYPVTVAKLNDRTLNRLRKQYLDAIKPDAEASPYVTDKRSDNFLHIGLIKVLYPGSTIVHTKRDPLDIAISTWFLDFAEPISYSNSLHDIGHYLAQYLRLMAHWMEVFPEIIPIQYERLVDDPRTQLEPVYKSLNLEPTDVTEPIVQRPIRTPSAWSVRGELHARSVGRWQRYADHLEPVRKELGL